VLQHICIFSIIFSSKSTVPHVFLNFCKYYNASGSYFDNSSHYISLNVAGHVAQPSESNSNLESCKMHRENINNRWASASMHTKFQIQVFCRFEGELCDKNLRYWSATETPS